MSQSSRIRYVDIARGIAIISIILGHLGNTDINRFVFTYHVPFFFLISGFFFSSKDKARVFIIKRIRSLLIPYIICCVLVILSAVIVNQIMNQGAGNKEVALYWLQASIYGAGDSYSTPFVIYGIGAIWFLLALFWASLLFFVVLKVKPIIRPIIVLAFFFLTHFSTKLFWFPASIQASGPALLYMYCGYTIKQNRETIKRIPDEVKIFLALIALGIWIEFICNFQGYWLVHDHMGRGVIDFIGSLCGCWWILILSKYVVSKIPLLSNALEYLGRFSLLVLCAHIIELDTFPWNTIIQNLFPSFSETASWYAMIFGKIIWAYVITIILSKWKVSRMLFGYEK